MKDPTYDDTRYVVELVAPGTVNTAPEKTIAAVADHGKIAGNTIDGSHQQSAKVFAGLASAGVDISDVFAALEAEGVDKFIASWQELLDSVSAELANHQPRG